MNVYCKIIISLLPVAFLIEQISADMAPQPQVVFTQASPGTFAADWQGVEGRTYFMQWSMDLVSWFYSPFIGFGDEMHSQGMAGSSHKLFIRLRYGDFLGITRLDEAMNADFDGDGLSNIFEVTYGYDPFQTISTIDGSDVWLDPDNDGLGNASEQANGSNPMVGDNPKLMLNFCID